MCNVSLVEVTSLVCYKQVITIVQKSAFLIVCVFNGIKRGLDIVYILLVAHFIILNVFFFFIILLVLLA